MVRFQSWHRISLLVVLAIVMTLAGVNISAEPDASAAGPTMKHTTYQDFLEGYGDGSLIPINIGGGDGTLELARLATGPNAWTTLSPGLPLPNAFHAATEANGCVYVSGGLSPAIGYIARVYSAAISEDGSLGTWLAMPNLPQALSNHAMVAANGYLFVLGGFESSGVKDTVYSARLRADCGLDPWVEQTQTPMPEELEFHQAAASGGYLFVVGGDNTTDPSTPDPFSTVYSAAIHADGTLDPWSETASLPRPLRDHGMAAAAGCLFVAGGHNNFVGSASVYSAVVQSNGVLGAWVQSPYSLPEELDALAVVVTNGYLFAVGGHSSTELGSRDVYRAPVADDCSVGAWVPAQPLDEGLWYHAAVAARGYILLLGGADEMGNLGQSDIYSGHVVPDTTLAAQAGDRATWGRYTHQFDLGSDLDMDRLAWGGTVDPTTTVSLRYRIAPADTAQFGPWSAFSSDNPVQIGQVSRYIQYELKVDSPSGNPGSITEVVLNPSGNFVVVQDEGGQPVAGARIYHNGRLMTDGSGQPLLTGSDGRLAVDDMQVGDTFVALALQKEETTDKGAHQTLDSTGDWAYRVFITSMGVLPDGTTVPHTVTQLGEQFLTVRRTNPLVLFNIVASVEWNAYTFADQNPDIPFDTYLKSLARAMMSASDFLYDVTNGQMAFGQVTIYDAGREWQNADIQIAASNRVRPRAAAGGIVSTSPFTYTSSVGLQTTFYPGNVRLGRAWNRFSGFQSSLAEADGFRTIVHEFAHYALFLFDEYFTQNAGGQTQPATCTGPEVRDALEETGSASIMFWQYGASELWQAGLDPAADTRCQNTVQYQVHGESDWETVVGIYGDDQASPRWTFQTPTSVETVNPGPFSMPLDLPQLDIVPGNLISTERVVLEMRDNTGARVPGGQVEVYLFKPAGGPPDRMLDQGSTGFLGDIAIRGAESGDIIKAVYWDGSLFVSQPFSPTTPIVLQPAGWNPVIEAIPFLDGSKLDVTVSNTGVLSGTITARLYGVGGGYAETTLAGGSVSYSGSFTLTEPMPEAHLYLQATAAGSGILAAGATLESVTSLSIGGAPGAHKWAHPPLDPASSDGNLHLHIPDGGLPNLTETMVTVMAARGVPPVPSHLTVVGMPYTISASGGLTETMQPSSLTMYYHNEALQGINENNLRIYYWNPGTAEWENRGGTVDTAVNSVSTPVTRFGIYAIMAQATCEIPLMGDWNLMSFPIRSSQPITGVIQPILGLDPRVYTYDTAGDTWLKYIPNLPPEEYYVNNLWTIEPGRGYWVYVSAGDVLRFPCVPVGQPTSLATTPAGRMPPLPSTFYRRVTVNGADVPNGTSVAALINGVKYAETRSLTYAGRAVYAIDVPGDDPTTPQVEGGARGDTLAFQVGDQIVEQTGTWHRGSVVPLDLAVSPPPTRHRLYLPLLITKLE